MYIRPLHTAHMNLFCRSLQNVMDKIEYQARNLGDLHQRVEGQHSTNLDDRERVIQEKDGHLKGRFQQKQKLWFFPLMKCTWPIFVENVFCPLFSQQFLLNIIIFLYDYFHCFLLISRLPPQLFSSVFESRRKCPTFSLSTTTF